MNKMNKTICLVTNWYPTKENPYQGVFFKEQAFAVSEKYDFVVLKYVERIKHRRSLTVVYDNQERNTREYTAIVRIPFYVIVADVWHDFYVKKILQKPIEGVGKYISVSHMRFRSRILHRIFRDYIADEIDLLYCVDAQNEAAVLGTISRLLGKPYIVSEHAPVPWPGTVLDDANKEAIEKADAFLAISNDKIRQLKLLNVQLPSTKYIGNMVDETQFTINRKNEENHIKTFIIVAAHSYYKNYDMFIDVMNRLKEITDIPFKVIIVGYGANKGYSKDIAKFEDKINKSRFADNVEMIPEVCHSDMGKVLNKADAFVMTSIQEGQPVSAMEAACCGLPIFSTKCGGVEDYVDEKMGRIYNIVDSEGMAHGLKDYLEGREVYNRDYIREQVVKRFGMRVFKKNFEDVMNSI